VRRRRKRKEAAEKIQRNIDVATKQGKSNGIGLADVCGIVGRLFLSEILCGFGFSQ
jgi:hypothetical protein